MTPEINFDISGAVPYVVDKFLGLVGQDSATTETRAWLQNLWCTARLDASHVQCVGMAAPVPISQIYQPTRLMGSISENGPDQSRQQTIHLSVEELLGKRINAVIKAGPGWGKTTLLHHIFLTTAKASDCLPFLFTLRRQTAVDDFQKFIDLLLKDHGRIEKLAKRIKGGESTSRILLLVDGYDEISEGERRVVSDYLMKFSAKAIGNYCLTCRSFYDVLELKAHTFQIAGFQKDDQLRFISAFARAFDSPIDPEAVVKELHDQGFAEFLSHPLLLALVCIVKSGPMTLSRNVIGLIDRAIDTLSFRWDLAKGVHREGLTPLDGKHRIQCLMRIAYELPLARTEDNVVYPIVERQLALWRWENLDPRKILLETARFYGIFVQTSNGWAFVHKTLQDYLAAKYWVEAGNFRPGRVSEWDTRAAYAACLTPDATASMEYTLLKRALAAFGEMLMNDPPFHVAPVAKALVEYWSRGAPSRSERGHELATDIDMDYLCSASSKFLYAIIAECLNRDTVGSDGLLAFSLVELFDRSERLPDSLFSKCREILVDEHSLITAPRNNMLHSVELSALAPQ